MFPFASQEMWVSKKMTLGKPMLQTKMGPK